MGPDITVEQHRYRRTAAIWWAAVLSALMVAGLLALALLLFLMDVFAVGAVSLLSPDSDVAAPDDTAYVEAVVLGVVVLVLAVLAMLLLAPGAWVAGWPPAAVGLVVATLAGLAGTVTLLLRLGIDPVGFVTAWT